MSGHSALFFFNEVLGAVIGLLPFRSAEDIFDAWKKNHGKVYEVSMAKQRPVSFSVNIG